MLKSVSILKQAMELYRLGVQIETAQQELVRREQLYGYAHALTMKKAQEIMSLTIQFDTLEKQHLMDTNKVRTNSIH